MQSTAQGVDGAAIDLSRVSGVIEALNEGFIVQDARGALVLFNTAATRILGLSAEELAGRTTSDPRWRAIRTDHTPFPVEEFPIWVATRTGQSVRDVVMGVHTPDGELRWISIHAQPVAEKGGTSPSAAIALFRDVTHEVELRQSERRSDAVLRATMECWPQGFLVVDDAAGCVVEFNRRFVELFQLSSDEAGRLRGAPLAQVRAWCGLHMVDATPLDEVFGAPNTVPMRRRMTRADGGTLECQSAALSGFESASHSRLLLFEDITSRLQAEDERRTMDRRLIEAQRLESLGALAGGIAHEFNNLLTAIIGSAELVRNASPKDSATQRQLDRVLDASARATKLCEEMIATAGPGPVNVRRLHLTDVVHRALQLMQPTTPARVRTEECLEPELPAVMADDAQIVRVFENLFSNACEAVQTRGGVVRVATGVSNLERADFHSMPVTTGHPSGEYVWFEVEDDGVGMDANAVARMFDPFYSTKFSGRGLGLSSVLSILRSHNGAVDVRSRPGEGTRVRVLLPAAK